MATSKTLELSIKIAGRMDKSLTAAINGTQSKIGSLTKSINNRERRKTEHGVFYRQISE